MKRRFALGSALIALALCFGTMSVSAKVGAVGGKWSGWWIHADTSPQAAPDTTVREPMSMEFTDASGMKGKVTAPVALEFESSTVDPDSGLLTIEAKDSTGKTIQLRLAGDATDATPTVELRGSMKSGDVDGEVYLTNSTLHWIEHTGLAVWIRESPSPYAFAGILLLHTMGMSIVFGINAGLDLRILGLARDLPLAPMRRYFPVLWFGFWLNATTGTLLLYADLTTRIRNPDFWVKLVFIVLAVLNVMLLKRRVFMDPAVDEKPLGADAKVLALTSLVFWVGAVTAGRLLAYVGPTSGLGN